MKLKTPPAREKFILLLFKFPNILKLFLAKNRRCRNYSAGETLKHKSFEVNCTHFRKSQTKHDVALFLKVDLNICKIINVKHDFIGLLW